MAHKTLISGTAYEIKGGRTLIGGTGYDIKKGRTLVGGTGYDISFSGILKVTYCIFVATGNEEYEVYIKINDKTYGIMSGSDGLPQDIEIPANPGDSIAFTVTYNGFEDISISAKNFSGCEESSSEYDTITLNILSDEASVSLYFDIFN